VSKSTIISDNAVNGFYLIHFPSLLVRFFGELLKGKLPFKINCILRCSEWSDQKMQKREGPKCSAGDDPGTA